MVLKFYLIREFFLTVDGYNLDEGSATVCLGVRDFEILLGFQISEWISKWSFGFRLNFYYSRFYLDFRFQNGFKGNT